MALDAVPERTCSRNPSPIRIEGDVAYVTLTRGFEAIIDTEDVPSISPWRWSAHVCRYGHVYACRSVESGGKHVSVMMHRQILGVTGAWKVDHVDGDGLNNRRANIRPATHQQNMQNMAVTRRNKLGLKGVHKARGSYRADMSYNGKTLHLGHYETPEEAAAAYRGASKALHGAFSGV